MKIKSLILASVALAAAASSANAATIVGETVRVQYTFPTETLVRNTISHTIGTPPANAYLGVVDFSMTDSSVLLRFNSEFAWSGATFNGLVITDLAGRIPNFTGFSVGETTNAAFTNARLSFDTNRLLVNWQAIRVFGGDTVRLDFTYAGQSAPVPEPAAWAMMIAGFGLVGGAMRRRVNYRAAATS